MVAASSTLGTALDAVARSLGNAREARRFVELAAERLGDRALLDASAGGRILLVRDRAHPPLVAWPPVVALVPAERRHVVSDVQIPGGSPPPGVARMSLEMDLGSLAPEESTSACSLRFAEGRHHVELAYDESGSLSLARPGPSRRLGLLDRDAVATATGDASALASHVVEVIDAHLGPLRVRAGAVSAAAVAELASSAIPSFRRELFQPSTRDGRGVALATGGDGWVGVTSSIDDALRAIDDDAAAVLLTFDALPTRIPGRFWEAGFHRWARVVGDAGDVAHALLREDDAAVTMIGEEVLERIDPFRLDAELDAADRDTRGVLAAIPDARPTPESSVVTAYRVVDEAHRRRVPTQLAMSQAAPGLAPWQLPNPDELPWQVARWRRAARR